jgi:hypothetical protein
MSKIKCELFCRSNSNHIELIYTGFRWLEQQGKIDISYHILRHLPPDFPTSSIHHLIVKVNGTKLILFDMLDIGDINPETLHRMDFYFKRSFNATAIGPELAYRKVFPLGLSYKVYEKYPSWFSFNRIFLEGTIGKMAKFTIRNIFTPFSSLFPAHYRPHCDNCFAEPDPSLPAGIIFMARLWDPSRALPNLRYEREVMNAMRVDCIRKLRQEFGSHFMGGLAHDEYTSRYFADCLLQDNRLSEIGNYVRLLRNYPIGVATNGLTNSIGWKFAEYVAFSRAVVSEKLCFEAPGLEAGKHYLEFTTADECVEAASRLMGDKQLLTEMMINNQKYYQTFLRPDLLVWNAISTALEHDDNV